MSDDDVQSAAFGRPDYLLLCYFARQTGLARNDESVGTIMSYLVTDLKHLNDRLDIDFSGVLLCTMTMSLKAEIRPLLKPPRIERGYFRSRPAIIVPPFRAAFSEVSQGLSIC